MSADTGPSDLLYRRQRSGATGEPEYHRQAAIGLKTATSDRHLQGSATENSFLEALSSCQLAWQTLLIQDQIFNLQFQTSSVEETQV